MKNFFCRAMLTAALISYCSAPSAAEPFVACGSLDQPGVEKEQLLKWSSDTLIAIYTYDFQNANQTIQNAHTYFTKKGYDDFQEIMYSNQWLPIIQRKKYDILPILDDNPTVLSEGLVDGIYTWSVKVPLVIYLRGPYDMSKQKKTISITLKRATLADSPSGLVIDAFQFIDDKMN